jgi:hypothetical protein
MFVHVSVFVVLGPPALLTTVVTAVIPEQTTVGRAFFVTASWIVGRLAERIRQSPSCGTKQRGTGVAI